MAGDTLDLSGALNKLMSDPTLLQSIASAIGGGSGAGTQPVTSPTEEKEENNEELTVASSQKEISDISSSIGDILPAISKLSAIGNLSSPLKNSTQDSRVCLLNALKPYLNPRRCDAIDKLVKFSSISELLKKI
ncbi:MAG: hypothetical protein J6Q78_03510 [Clostridia bacterium]|jgi:hypothetical protein|nr:hypothetical protein [Clostridia bacterium]